jgi:cytochrome c553
MNMNLKKYLLILVSVVSIASSGLVFASETTSEHEESDMAKPVPFGDVEAGKNKAAACTACHGRNGNSNVASYPKLAGQGAQYLYKQMQDYKSGSRSDPIMSAQISGRSNEDMKDMAAYFAAQETSLGTVKKEFVELGQKIYRSGNAETGLPACIACHGPAGKGMASAGFPKLSGQHAQYTQTQLKAFRAAGRGDHGKVRRRTNDAEEGQPAMMRELAAKMSDDEIEAVSSYISGLR